jgi:hypothetical protein
MGLGGVSAVPLAKAREKAAAARPLLADDKDALQERRGLLARQRGTKTFAECADAYIIAHAPGWPASARLPGIRQKLVIHRVFREILNLLR